MRWSGWRAKAPFKDSIAPKVLAAVDAALSGLGADPDPECWVIWGDDPRSRYTLLAPSPSGLVMVNVRVAVPGEGPRAGGKVVRWQRVQLGELAVEIQGGHRLVTFQVENQVLNGADAAADGIAVFAQAMFAAVDGRSAPIPAKAGKSGSARAGATKSGAAAKSGAATKSRPATPRAATVPPARRLAAPKGSPS